MKKYTKSHSSIFLLELILNLIIFTVLLVIGLNFFLKAHNLSTKTTDLHRAVTECNNVATLFKSGDGSFDLLSKQYSDIIITDTQAHIYYNSDFCECSSSEASYTLTITITPCNYQIYDANIKFSKEDEIIYQINAVNRKPLTPGSKEV